MSTTPLYKPLKKNGTTFYAFPGAAEDISLAYQNENYSMSFSKFILLEIPERKFATTSQPSVLDIDNSFEDSQVVGSVPANFGDQIVESLRNYVANHETTIRNTRLSNTEFFYDNTTVGTTTEKIFWKWARKTNILGLEPALEQDEYFENLQEFESNNITDNEYFPEKLWKEREVVAYNIKEISQGTSVVGINATPLAIEFDIETNYKIDDYVLFSNMSNANLTFLNDTSYKVIEIVPPSGTTGQIVKVDLIYTGGVELESIGTVTLVYNKLIQYIGEITSVNNVSDVNKFYTEVVAHIGDHVGQTPDILFRTMFDDNYKPNLEYPILPADYQPEINGTEIFTSPIRSNPTIYPGDYFGQFDTNYYAYTTSSGDSERRKGKYFGITGDVNNPIIDTSEIDGLSIDFDTDHYAKMNIINREVSNFDEFNALDVNNNPPKDFKFNSILWYYTVTDSQGNSTENLYGISFLDNPDNDTESMGNKFPVYDKFVSNGTQDGTSYAFSLNLNFDVSNDIIQPTFSPNNINSLFSFDLYNDAMRKLASSNDSFLRVLGESNNLKQELSDIKQLLYTQTDLNTITNKINSLNELLNSYKSMQIVSTDSIRVNRNESTSPPTLELFSADTRYDEIFNITSSQLYDINQIIPMNIIIPEERDFLVNILNDDITNVIFTNTEDRLTVVIDRDLSYKQNMTLRIMGEENSIYNKKLDVFINHTENGNTNLSPLISNIDLPVYYNETTLDTNSAFKLTNDTFKVKLGTSNITFVDDETMSFVLDSVIGFEVGDIIYINNLLIGDITVTDYSTQYRVGNIDSVNNTIQVDITSNNVFKQYIDTFTTFPVIVNDPLNNLLKSQPNITFNKGYEINVIRISNDNDSNISGRYDINIESK